MLYNLNLLIQSTFICHPLIQDCRLAADTKAKNITLQAIYALLIYLAAAGVGSSSISKGSYSSCRTAFNCYSSWDYTKPKTPEQCEWQPEAKRKAQTSSSWQWDGGLDLVPQDSHCTLLWEVLPWASCSSVYSEDGFLAEWDSIEMPETNSDK